MSYEEFSCNRKECPLHSGWIRIMDLNGLENMISVPMNFLMEMAEDGKARRQKEFLLEILANGGMAQKKIAEEAEGRGIKRKNVCGMPNGNLRLIL